jgi:hypothetical protein
VRRGILRRLEVLEEVAPDSGSLDSYLDFDEEGNLVFPRGPLPLAYLRDLTELVNDAPRVSEPGATKEAQAK